MRYVREFHRKDENALTKHTKWYTLIKPGDPEPTEYGSTILFMDTGVLPLGFKFPEEILEGDGHLFRNVLSNVQDQNFALSVRCPRLPHVR